MSKTIKLCEGHIGGLGLLQALGVIDKNIKAIKVDKDQCEQCIANKKARKTN